MYRIDSGSTPRVGASQTSCGCLRPWRWICQCNCDLVFGSTATGPRSWAECGYMRDASLLCVISDRHHVNRKPEVMQSPINWRKFTQLPLHWPRLTQEQLLWELPAVERTAVAISPDLPEAWRYVQQLGDENRSR